MEEGEARGEGRGQTQGTKVTPTSRTVAEEFGEDLEETAELSDEGMPKRRAFKRPEPQT